MTCRPISRVRAGPGVFRERLVAAGLAALAAACGGQRPDPLPDRPTIQLSKDHLVFEMDAYRPATVSPASEVVRITNGSRTPLGGFPNHVAITYQIGAAWLAVPQFGIDDPGYRLTFTLDGAGALDAGTYRATVAVSWDGAANSPAAVEVELVVRPSVPLWRAGNTTMVPYRFAHAAVALPGRGALLVGGKDVPPYTAPSDTIEALDGTTGTWSLAGTLWRGRSEHTATVLENGLVWVAGGRSDDTAAPPGGTWELYSPWEQGVVDSGELLQARYGQAAVRLRGGEVLLMGGATHEVVGGQPRDVATRRCELFDPGTRTMNEVEPLHGALSADGAAVLLEDGRVLVANLTPEGNAVSAEIFDPGADPRAGTWTTTGPRQRRILHGLAALPGGGALAFGGLDPVDLSPLRSAEVYDPATNAWTPTGSLHVNHAYVAGEAVTLPNGKVLVAGGFTRAAFDGSTLSPTAAVEVFDPATGAWTVASALPTPLGFHTLTALSDGTLLAAGGYLYGENRAAFCSSACWR